jgi:hypothetical protein
MFSENINEGLKYKQVHWKVYKHEQLVERRNVVGNNAEVKILNKSVSYKINKFTSLTPDVICKIRD